VTSGGPLVFDIRQPQEVPETHQHIKQVASHLPDGVIITESARSREWSRNVATRLYPG